MTTPHESAYIVDLADLRAQRLLERELAELDDAELDRDPQDAIYQPEPWWFGGDAA